MKTIWGKFSLLAIVLLLAGPAVADEDLLDVLLKNGTITQEQYDQLRNQYQKRPAVPLAEPEPAPPVATAVQGEVKVSPEGGLRGRLGEDFTFRLGGRLQVDGAVYDEDAQGLGNGSEIRRARLSLEGTAWRDWEWQLEFDFGEDEVEIKDAYIEYIGFEPFTLRGGNFKEPFSLEEQMSSRDITFMERALPNVFAPDRNIGFGAQMYGERWTAALGVFGEGVDDNNNGGEQDEGYGVTSRFAFVPLATENGLIHLGGSASYRATGDDNRVRFRARPESHITDVRFVNTGQIADVDDVVRYGGEAAAVYGPFSLQGEYIGAHVNRDASSSLDFDGYYVYGSWVLTGESRPYRYKKGEFLRVVPENIVGKGGGYGAWELALRYSALDLTDGDIAGGEEDNLTFGLNWYPTPNIRLMANYIMVDNDANANDGGDALGSDDPDIFQVRGQIAF